VKINLKHDMRSLEERHELSKILNSGDLGPEDCAFMEVLM